MNQLSWLLYLANVSDNLSWFITFLTLVITLVCVGVIVALFQDMKPDDRKVCLNMAKWFGPALCLLIITNALLPSKETIYAIAASELGESAYKSETGQKAMKAINSWIDRQITPSKKENNDAAAE